MPNYARRRDDLLAQIPHGPWSINFPALPPLNAAVIARTLARAKPVMQRLAIDKRKFNPVGHRLRIQLRREDIVRVLDKHRCETGLTRRGLARRCQNSWQAIDTSWPDEARENI
ncbi:unnamed protein product [Leptosia nina]|uniref:Uncharacterized protein n=1 Tax=Leptosia nina TaxID=320188 RepID=A0AAV1K3A0_9NEOP